MMTLALEADQATILLEMAQKTVLDRLPVSIGSSFDSHAEEHNSTCLLPTRVRLVRKISAWADYLGAEAGFWLNGIVGTGKSTIFRTIAQSFAGKGHLGASFFFKRGEADRGSLFKFFTAIVADPIVREPAIARHVKDAINTEPTILTNPMREQFDKLILQPLSNISPNAGKDDPIIIIVDAVHGCGREDDIRLMIPLFSHAKSLQSMQLNIFLTSRPELPVRLSVKVVEGKYQDLIIHQIPEPVVEHDIFAFLEYELAKIRSWCNASVPEDRQLATKWPGQSNIKSLKKMAIPFFIFAAAVCRLLVEHKCGNPEQQLKDVLHLRTRSQESQLDATYLPVLDKLIVGLSAKQRDNVLQQFRDVLFKGIVRYGMIQNQSKCVSEAMHDLVGLCRLD
ncbi:hypothetical protein B0J13DRAFT_470014 [Dactylonectria estremocensis]|uniref:Nephrocystin 3-like N-terminal domain-containing protein n=1 Tax=Dactylonectria estremocensis TaxID=1079267 RepID=A0A9P9F8U7_9HYPO|nr:hypothetical protein B0J13DRAFT_470014 [Dactylonectria estremocensis]